VYFSIQSRPTIALLLIVRDEVDIVAQCISWHLNRGIDCALIIDNGSTDGTRDILSQYDAADDNILVFDEPEGFDKPGWWKRMATIAREKYHADWVLPIDADEFWFAKDSDYRSELKGPANVITSSWRNMIPDPGKNWTEFDHYGNVLNYSHTFRKNLVACHDSLVLDRGNHEPQRENLVQKLSDNLIVYHYPVRSWEQFEKKVRRAARVIALNPDEHPYLSFHWKRWHSLREQDKLKALFDQVVGQRCGVCTYDPTMKMLLGNRDFIGSNLRHTQDKTTLVASQLHPLAIP